MQHELNLTRHRLAFSVKNIGRSCQNYVVTDETARPAPQHSFEVYQKQPDATVGINERITDLFLAQPSNSFAHTSFFDKVFGDWRQILRLFDIVMAGPEAKGARGGEVFGGGGFLVGL